MGKESACSVREPCSIPGLGKTLFHHLEGPVFPLLFPCTAIAWESTGEPTCLSVPHQHWSGDGRKRNDPELVGQD